MKRQDALYPVREAAQRFGRSEQWVRDAIKKRVIAHVRIGGRVYVPESAFEEVRRYVPAALPFSAVPGDET